MRAVDEVVLGRGRSAVLASAMFDVQTSDSLLIILSENLITNSPEVVAMKLVAELMLVALVVEIGNSPVEHVLVIPLVDESSMRVLRCRSSQLMSGFRVDESM